MKTCTHCGLDKPLSEFQRKAKSKDGYNWACKPCDRAALRDYRRRHPNKQREWLAANRDRARAHAEAWFRSNPIKKRVHEKVKYAVLTGVLTRPAICDLCGRSGRIEAHHEDYRLPLVVQWLCSGCHHDTPHENARRSAELIAAGLAKEPGS